MEIEVEKKTTENQITASSAALHLNGGRKAKTHPPRMHRLNNEKSKGLNYKPCFKFRLWIFSASHVWQGQQQKKKLQPLNRRSAHVT